MQYFSFSPAAVVLISLTLTAFIGAVDYVTVPEVAIFYLLPIFLSAWLAGRWQGVAISIICAAVWLLDDLSGSSPVVDRSTHIWEATVRFGFFLIFSFTISSLRKALDKEKGLARTDNLTGIANGRHFLEIAGLELQKLKRYGHPFTLAFMDVDNFKTVNDTLGHNAGDRLLRLIAGTIKAAIRSADIAARVGGDEFTILLTETGEGHAREAVTKVQRHLLQAVRGKQYPVTFSIGAVTFNDAPGDTDKMLHIVDEVMYSAKNSGKNKVRFEVFVSPEKLAFTK